jgi:hypothetical protein
MNLTEELQSKLGLGVSQAWLQQCVQFLTLQDANFPSYDSARQLALVFSQLLPTDLYLASDGALPDLRVRAVLVAQAIDHAVV